MRKGGKRRALLEPRVNLCRLAGGAARSGGGLTTVCESNRPRSGEHGVW